MRESFAIGLPAIQELIPYLVHCCLDGVPSQQKKSDREDCDAADRCSHRIGLGYLVNFSSGDKTERRDGKSS